VPILILALLGEERRVMKVDRGGMEGGRGKGRALYILQRYILTAFYPHAIFLF
jgi:hypothetical protein